MNDCGRQTHVLTTQEKKLVIEISSWEYQVLRADGDFSQEREILAQQRTAQLVRANQALRGCLDALASVPKLDEFIGQVMAAITAQLRAVSSALRMFNRGQNSIDIALIFRDGRVMSPDEAKVPKHLRSLRLEEIGLGSLDKPISL